MCDLVFKIRQIIENIINMDSTLCIDLTKDFYIILKENMVRHEQNKYEQ